MKPERTYKRDLTFSRAHRDRRYFRSGDCVMDEDLLPYVYFPYPEKWYFGHYEFKVRPSSSYPGYKDSMLGQYFKISAYLRYCGIVFKPLCLFMNCNFSLQGFFMEGDSKGKEIDIESIPDWKAEIFKYTMEEGFKRIVSGNYDEVQKCWSNIEQTYRRDFETILKKKRPNIRELLKTRQYIEKNPKNFPGNENSVAKFHREIGVAKALDRKDIALKCGLLVHRVEEQIAKQNPAMPPEEKGGMAGGPGKTTKGGVNSELTPPLRSDIMSQIRKAHSVPKEKIEK